jgi:predicted phosphodiesterase
MRVALLSDIHANLAALEAVLADAEQARAEAFWHLGDVVGYGPEPVAVVHRLVELGAAGVLGNHDAAAVGLLATDDFNRLAAEAARWTSQQLDDESRQYLLALGPVRVDHHCTLVHGTLRDPLREYLATYMSARAHFALQETACSVVGHTHVPLLLREAPGGLVEAIPPGEDELVAIGEDRVCVNPGGVGQPRDGDPRACYALLDTSEGTVHFRRVEYDIGRTQRLMADVGLPAPLSARLAVGR